MTEGIEISFGDDNKFMEWKCTTDGVWSDQDGAPASEREISLLDSIVLLNDEKRRLLDTLSLLMKNIDGIEIALTERLGANPDSFRVMYPGLHDELSRMIKVTKVVGKQYDL